MSSSSPSSSSQRRDYYVYVYRDSTKGNKPFYIGKGSGWRLYAHHAEALLWKRAVDAKKKVPKVAKIEAILAAVKKNSLVVEVVAYNLTETEAFFLEALAINRFRRWLTNIQCPNLSKAHVAYENSPSTKEWKVGSLDLNAYNLALCKVLSSRAKEVFPNIWFSVTQTENQKQLYANVGFHCFCCKNGCDMQVVVNSKGHRIDVSCKKVKGWNKGCAACDFADKFEKKKKSEKAEQKKSGGTNQNSESLVSQSEWEEKFEKGKRCEHCDAVFHFQKLVMKYPGVKAQTSVVVNDKRAKCRIHSVSLAHACNVYVDAASLFGNYTAPTLNEEEAKKRVPFSVVKNANEELTGLEAAAKGVAVENGDLTDFLDKVYPDAKSKQ